MKLAVRLVVALIAWATLAEDVITLKSGQTLRGEVVEYADGTLKIRMADGKIKKGKIALVEHVSFGEQAGPGAIVVNVDRDFKYVPKGWPLGLTVGQTAASALKETPYERLSREPQYKSQKVQYGFLKLGNARDNKFTFVIDDLENDTWIGYFDKNNNEDLTDDGPPLTSQGSGKFATILALEVPVVLPGKRKPVSRPYNLWFFINSGGAKFYARCHYTGHVEIGEVITRTWIDKKYTAIVYEMFKHDALYLESGIWIDLDGDGKLDKAKEHFENGATVNMGGKDYTIRLNYP